MSNRNPASDEYDERLPGLAAAGMTLREISDDMEKSPEAVRNAAKRRGLSVTPEGSIDHYRKAIQDMKMTDAVEYLLDCIGCLQGVSSTKATAKRWDFHLTRSETRLLAALEAHAPYVVPREALYDALYFDKIHKEPPEIKIVDVLICNIRKKLPPGFGTIENEWGVGYRLEQEKPE